MKFISLDEVLSIHEVMLSIGKGRSGIHDFTLLHSAIERAKIQFGGEFLYTTIWFMAAAMLQSLVKSHPFEDGNKRTAYFTTMWFLDRNGHAMIPVDKDVLKFMVEVDTKNKTVEEIADWLKKHSKKK